MKSAQIFDRPRAIGVIVTVIAATTFLLSHYAREHILAWRLGGVYLGAQGVRLQKGANDCGPASLQMIFDYYEIPSAVHEMRQAIGMNVNGSTMLALKELAELKGLQVQGWRLTSKDFSSVFFPALLFVRDDHYIVADSVSGENVFVRDPAIGRLRISRGKLIKIWKGEILLFRKK